MKKATFALLTIALTLVAAFPTTVKAQATTEKKERVLQDTPNISWDKSKHVFGSIEHQKPVTAEFEFTNNTGETVVVTKVGTTCGCTAASYPKEPVKPGEKANIKLKYDAVAPGFFKKAAKIEFSNGSAKEIEIEGKVVVRRANIK